MKINQSVIVLIAACSAATVINAALVPLSPVGGAEVPLVPDAQKKVMSLPTLEERIALFQEDKKNGKVIRHDKFWRKARPLVLKWKITEGETGPWKVEIGKKPDLSDARVWYIRAKKVDAATGRETGDAASNAEQSFTVPLANLEIARDYYWRVTSRGRCGFSCKFNHGCKESKRVSVSEIASFRTEDRGPRWIEIEGNVANMRDFGGWRTLDGRRVRQGMAFRGQGLNSNSVMGDRQGRNRLTVEDVKYLTKTLGIRTDLDLRGHGETADMTESPLGPGISFIQHSSACYKGIFYGSAKNVMAENFRVFCNPTNYPIYFHCIGGADRTGSLAYTMLAVLGVDRHDIETDWESTFYPRIPDENPDPNYWCRESHFNDGFSKYGSEGDSLKRRAELYLIDCGITQEEIERFRSIMLE